MSVQLLIPESPVSGYALPAPKAPIEYLNNVTQEEPFLFLIYGLLIAAFVTMVQL